MTDCRELTILIPSLWLHRGFFFNTSPSPFFTLPEKARIVPKCTSKHTYLRFQGIQMGRTLCLVECCRASRPNQAPPWTLDSLDSSWSTFFYGLWTPWRPLMPSSLRSSKIGKKADFFLGPSGTVKTCSLSAHPHEWIHPDLVPPSHFLFFNPGTVPNRSCILVQPHLWCPHL